MDDLSSAKKARHAQLYKQSLYTSLVPIAVGLLGAPLGWPIPLAAAVACGIQYNNTRRKLIELHSIKEYDKRVETNVLKDAELYQNLFLGKGIPFDTWRKYQRKAESNHGGWTPELRMKMAHRLYPTYKPFYLSKDILTRHVACLAATGLLKTELIKSILYQQAFSGGGAIVLDAKGDPDLAGAAVRYMALAGRLDEIDVVSLSHPHLRHYNPFQSGGVRGTLSMAMKTQPRSSEAFWQNLARHSLTAAILALKLQPGSPSFTMRDLFAVFSDLNLMRELSETIRESESKYHKSGREYVLSYLRYWYKEEANEFNTQRYKDMLNSVTATLSSFIHSEYDEVVNSHSATVDIKRSLREGRMVVISASDLEDTEGLSMFFGLVMADVGRAIGELQVEGFVPMQLTPLICDEYGSYANESDIPIAQLARSAGVPFMLFMQGKGFLDRVDRTFAENLLSNCWTHIYGDIRSIETRQFAAEMSGTLMNKLSQETSSENFGSSYGSENGGLIGQDSESSGISKGFKEQRETRLQPDDFADLEQGDALLVGKSGTYRLRTPLVQDPGKIKSWDDIALPPVKHHPRPRLDVWDRYIERTKKILGASN